MGFTQVFKKRRTSGERSPRAAGTAIISEPERKARGRGRTSEGDQGLDRTSLREPERGERSPRGLQPGSVAKDEKGIALFMVLAAVSVLAILVTEFTYISQVNQMIAFGGLDQLKVHYLAKSGLKVSLLRLKAYQQVKGFLKSTGVGAQMVPAGLVQKIWSFPFYYPLPTNIPGMSVTDKDTITKFQKDSNLEGSYSAVIESESGKFNLNTLLASYAPSGTPSGTPTGTPAGTTTPPSTQTPNPGATPGAFDPTQARESLFTFIQQLLQNRFDTDADFAANYRDLKLNDLVDQMVAWADRTYERTTPVSLDKVPMKKGPYYSLRELSMLPTMDDELYQFLAPNFTVSTTPGINLNTMKEMTLRGIIPQLTKEEVAEFFKFRDSEEADNQFKSKQDFYSYLLKNASAFQGRQSAVDELDGSLTKRGIRLVTDESEFKITVQAQLNQVAERIEAWVTLDSGATATGAAKPPGTASTPPPAQPLSGPQTAGAGPSSLPPDVGIRINFMKIL